MTHTEAILWENFYEIEHGRVRLPGDLWPDIIEVNGELWLKESLGLPWYHRTKVVRVTSPVYQAPNKGPQATATLTAISSSVYGFEG